MIAQRFVNGSETDTLETEFRFPVEESAAITSLVIKLENGREIEARVMDKEKAEETYQDSIASGHTPYLAQKTGNDQMTLFVGNLAPNTSV
jgi:hypothetical protein